MRGFLGGVSIGAIVAAGGFVVWSLSVPLPQTMRVDANPPEASQEPVERPTTPEDRPQTDSDLVEALPVVPEPVAPDAAASPSALDGADTAPTEKPEVSEVAGTQAEVPVIEPETPQSPDRDTGNVTLEPGSEVPDAPEQDAAVAVSTTPAAEPVAQDSARDGAALQAEEGTTAPAVQAPTVAPVAPPAANLPSLGEAPETAVPAIILPETAIPAEAPVSEPETGEERAALPTADDPDRSQSPSIGTPVRPLTERNTEAAAAAPAVAEVAEVADDTGNKSPFEANSEPFQVLPDLPLMSIVLIDDEDAIGAEALVGFPYPITFAISPEDPKAGEKAAARRAAGFEVMILGDLPRGAAPQDAETALPIWLRRLPQAAGVIEGVDTGLQGNRALADQMANLSKDLGLGFVLQSKGLNTVQKLALRDGVPSGVVFRDFDGAGQDPRAIRRFLDQAAFRAGQEGAVIMLGRLRPDTISALLIWGLQDRASRVMLAPLSASLRQNLKAQQP